MSSRMAAVLFLLLMPAVASASTVVFTEVFYDHSSGDDGYEWVEIYNGTIYPVDLSGYSLGWGGTDYTYGTAQLSGTIPGCTVWVIGGPLADAENGNPGYDLVVNFDPDIENSGATADGVALFDVEASEVTPTTVPIDVVIYGGANTNNLIDETGAAGAVDVGDAPEGQSVMRTSWEGNWIINDTPHPGWDGVVSPVCGPVIFDKSSWGNIKALYE